MKLLCKINKIKKDFKKNALLKINMCYLHSRDDKNK